MTDRTLPITLPEWMWGRLASIADRNDRTVAELATDSLLRVLNEDTARLDELTAEARAAKRAGWRIPRRGQS